MLLGGVLLLSLAIFYGEASAHDNIQVHPYIAEQAFFLWPNDTSHEIYQNLGRNSIFTGCSDTDLDCIARSCAHAGTGATIREGAKEEDDYDPLAQTCNVDPSNVVYGYYHHYFDPDIPDPNGLHNQIVGSGWNGALWQARAYWYRAKVAYSIEPVDKGLAYWYLGRIAHLLADASVPAHVHNDSHAIAFVDGKDSYEVWMAESLRYQQWDYRSAPSLDLVGGYQTVDALFYNLAQQAQCFPSDDSLGNTTNWDASYFECPNTSGWNSNFDWLLLIDPLTLALIYVEDHYIVSDNLRAIGDKLIPLAIHYTAQLYRLFWREFHIDIESPDTLVVLDDSSFRADGKINGVAVIQWEWDFDYDGYPAHFESQWNGQTAWHLYKSAGTKTVAARATAAGHEPIIVTKTISVIPRPIDVDFPNGFEDLHRHFSTPEPVVTIKQYTWNYGDGTPVETGRTQSHTYTIGGYYMVTLTLTLDDNTTIQSQKGMFVGPGTRYIQGHTIYDSETWYEGGTYVVSGGITVAQGATLIIEPGVVVKFANQQGITVHGTLDARGTDAKKIVFTSVWDDTYGGNTDPSGSDHTLPGDTWQVCPECVGDGRCSHAANYWGQLNFSPASTNSVIDRAIILYGGSARSGVWCYNPYGAGMLSIQSSSVTVTNSTVSHSWQNGIDVSNASPVITGDTISGNGGHGIYLSDNGGSPVITGDTISGNGGHGIYLSGNGGSPVITGDTISGNVSWGIACSVSPTPFITGNIVSNNGAGGISCSPSVLSGNTISGNTGSAIRQDASGTWANGTNTISGNTYDGVAITGGTVTRDTTFTANGALYLINSTVTVAEGVTLSIEPGVVVKFANQQGITVHGTLDARGTDDKKIVFTSVWDDTYRGNTDPSGSDHTLPGDTWQVCPECVGDGRCSHAANYWGQLNFSPASTNSVIDRAIILYGGSARSGVWCYNPYGAGMLSIQSSSVTVTNSTVSHSWQNGIDVSNASPVITGDTISGNGGHGIYLSDNGGSPVITGDTISGNGGHGIYLSGNGGSPVITGDTISGNVSWGIACSVSPTPFITGNIVSNNGAGGISCSPSVLSGNTISGNTGSAIRQDASGTWANGTNTISGNTYDGVAITGGTVTRDTTFTANGALYLINSTVTVAEGVTLSIEPGVVVKFANQQGITVHGTLDARGTDDKKIVFTSVWDDTYRGNTDPSGSDHTLPGDTWQVCPECVGDGRCSHAANYWGQLNFSPASTNSVIDRAIILYGGSARSGVWCYNPYGAGMLSIQSSSVTVTNSTVSHSWQNGIDVSNASPVITGDTISGNGGHGIYLSDNGGSPVITGDTISGNGGHGIYLSGNGGSPVITGDTISGNVSWGIACSVSPTPFITGNIVSNNGAGGISCSPSVLSGNTISGNTGSAIRQDASGTWANGTNTISGNTYDGVAITGGTVTRDTTFTANGALYLINSTVTVAEGVTLSIEPGVVVKFANQQGITVHGTLDARGTDDKKIVFTSVWDDTYRGNTDPSGSDHTLPGDTWQVCPECVGDGRCSHAANYWGQLNFSPASTNSVIDRAIILYGGSARSGVWCYNPYGTGMLFIQSSSVTVTNSTVSHSWQNGIDVSNASPVITGDTISGNGGYGLSYVGSIPLIAINNDWGDPSGPLDSSDDRLSGGLYNPNGLGDRVGDRVNYYPWTGMTGIGQTTTPTGLSGVSGNHAIDLSWNANTEPFLGGYKIYYGTSSSVSGTPKIVGNVSADTLTGLSNGITYYISISSMNSVGVESPKSIEITVTPGCSYSIDPESGIVGAVAGGGSVAVTTGSNCSWNASTNEGWLTVSPPTNGSGSGTINYSYSANSSLTPRTGTLFIADKTFTLTQAGLQGCTFILEPTSHIFGSTGGTGSSSVTAPAGCGWTASTVDSWITITSPQGSGNGAVNFNVSSYVGSVSRSGQITVEGHPVTVTQSASCSRQPVRLILTPSYYSNIATAYDMAQNNDSIQVQGITFIGDFLFDLGRAITLSGGFDCDFSTNLLQTTIKGSLTVTGGTVQVENIVIE